MLDWLEIGKIVIKTVKKTYEFKNRLDLERYCNQIIDEYELNYNKTTEEFLEKFEKVPSHKQTIFLKCYPDYREYLDHVNNNPGTDFISRH